MEAPPAASNGASNRRRNWNRSFKKKKRTPTQEFVPETTGGNTQDTAVGITISSTIINSATTSNRASNTTTNNALINSTSVTNAAISNTSINTRPQPPKRRRKGRGKKYLIDDSPGNAEDSPGESATEFDQMLEELFDTAGPAKSIKIADSIDKEPEIDTPDDEQPIEADSDDDEQDIKDYLLLTQTSTSFLGVNLSGDVDAHVPIGALEPDFALLEIEENPIRPTRKQKGSWGLAPHVDDPELQEQINNAWQKNRLAKSSRKIERETLRHQGLLEAKKDGILDSLLDLRPKYSTGPGMKLPDFKREMESFCRSDSHMQYVHLQSIKLTM
jgi:hypothetical protein